MTRLTLDQCGDTVSNAELIAVLGIQKSKFYELKRHGLLPDPLPGFSSRYSKVAIASYLANPAAVTKRFKRTA